MLRSSPPDSGYDPGAVGHGLGTGLLRREAPSHDGQPTRPAYAASLRLSGWPDGAAQFNEASTPVPRVLLSGQPNGAKTFNWPVIAPGTSSSTTVTVTTAVPGDRAVASMAGGSGGLILFAEATAVDTVTVTAFNPTGTAIDLASATLTVSLVR